MPTCCARSWWRSGTPTELHCPGLVGEMVRVVIDRRHGGIAWFSLIAELLLGAWPTNPEKSAISVIVYDAHEVERSRIPVRSLIEARELRSVIKEKSSTMSEEEVAQWHREPRWAELQKKPRFRK